jgi:pimeloyl-ACP methyl ester carboxylesterase
MSSRVLVRTLRLFAAVALALVIIGVVWQWVRSRQDVTAIPPPGVRVDVGGFRLHLWCIGTGSPTVVFESGLGGGAFDWGYVHPELGRGHRACTYDRAGYGYSDTGPRPRTSKQIASELASLLDKMGFFEPIILVGHSFGGYNARVFITEYPGKVGGLVLVDASHEDQGRRYAEAGAPSGDLPAFVPYVLPLAGFLGITRLAGFSPGLSLRAIAPNVQPYVVATRFRTAAVRAAAAEYRALAESSAQVRASRRTMALPLIVLSRTRERDATSGRVHDEMQADLAKLSMKSCRTRVANSGHLIPTEQPRSVIESIDAVAEAVIVGSAPRCGSEAVTRRP